jgi:hypothetical protein
MTFIDLSRSPVSSVNPVQLRMVMTSGNSKLIYPDAGHLKAFASRARARVPETSPACSIQRLRLEMTCYLSYLSLHDSTVPRARFRAKASFTASSRPVWSPQRDASCCVVWDQTASCVLFWVVLSFFQETVYFSYDGKSLCGVFLVAG